MEKVKDDKKLKTYWRCANVMAIERMGYTDHGPTHVKIVANLSLKLATNSGRKKTHRTKHSGKLRHEK